MLLLTACQIRGARACARLSLAELSALSGVSVSTLRRIEDQFGVPESVQTDKLVKLLHTFESLGFQFSSQDPRGPAIFWKRDPERTF